MSIKAYVIKRYGYTRNSMAMSLVYQSTIALMDSGAPFTDSYILNDVIFSVDQEKGIAENKIAEMDVEIKELTSKLHKYELSTMDQEKIYDLSEILERITHVLFDVFKYSEITDAIDVEWKEYFHVLYDVYIPRQYEGCQIDVYTGLHSSYILYDKFEPPNRDPVCESAKHAQRLFVDFRELHSDIVSKCDLATFIANNRISKLDDSNRLVELYRQRAVLEEKLEIYYSLIEWSMH